MGALVASLDNGCVGIPDTGYRFGFLVGVLRTRLGWLVVLGSSRKRLLHAVACRYCVNALAGSDRKRGTFKAWTVLLAISAFSLSLLGTFLVRSGVLVSVHAFASDPTRGLFILAFLVIVIGGSLLLYALRASEVRVRGNFELLSRENACWQTTFCWLPRWW